MARTEAILVFRSINDAIMGERQLLDCNIEVMVMPTPRSIGPGCTMVLRLNSSDIEKAKVKLGESISGIFYREGEGFVPWSD